MKDDQKYLLANILRRGKNNFDLFRLLAAFIVIIGHAYVIAPQPPLKDFVLTYLHFDYSGSLAVKFFFFLSGLLVTNSLIRKPEPLPFIIRRIFRMFPGLFVCLIVSVFIVGVIFTKLPLYEYFAKQETWAYLIKNSLLISFDLQWRLPGVFSTASLGLNGSLWTIPYEFTCYLYLAIFCGIGLFMFRFVANAIFLTIIIVAFLAPQWLPTQFANDSEAFLLPACFALGAIFALNEKLIQINFTGVVLLWMFEYMVKQPSAHIFLFYLAFFYSIIFIAALPFVVNRLKMPFDASYGVYVYGFMIQMCLAAVFPHLGLHGNQLLAIILAFLIGTVSWFFIEKPAIALGVNLTSKNGSEMLHKKLNTLWSFLSRHNDKKKLQGVYFIGLEFIVLLLCALVMHALALKFIYPGYYSPLWPNHTDFYMPAAFAHSGHSFLSYYRWPRPMGIMFMAIIGRFGIRGSIACIIGVVLVNSVLVAMIMRRIIKIEFNWIFLIAFFTYTYLLFSHPHLYAFYTEDPCDQLSFFFLIIAATGSFILFRKQYHKIAFLTLFFFILLAFLSKETYTLAALVVGGAWFLYERKRSLFSAFAPILAIGCAVVFMIGDCIFSHSPFVNFNRHALDSTYTFKLSPVSIFHEWIRYAYQGTGWANIIILTMIAVASYVCFRKGDKKFLYLFVICFFTALISWLPNALLPNHHYSGYSWNGAYLLFSPVLFIAAFWQQGWKWGPRFFLIIIIFSAFSPLLHKKAYSESDWTLIQENTQRNLLRELAILTRQYQSKGQFENILITGLNFPFNPFYYPLSLSLLQKEPVPHVDVVTYSADFRQPSDSVRFIRPNEINIGNYSSIWMFASDGHLIQVLHKGDVLPKPVDQLTSLDFILFPDLKKIIVYPIESRSLDLGNTLMTYQQPLLALAYFYKNAQKNPENAYSYFYLGIALEQLKRNHEAELYFKKAMMLDTSKKPNPGFKDALQRVAATKV